MLISSKDEGRTLSGAEPRHETRIAAVERSSTWLTVAEAAQHAGLSLDTIYTACERGDLRHVRVGGRRAIRLRAEWIDSWLEQYARGA